MLTIYWYKGRVLIYVITFNWYWNFAWWRSFCT